MNEDSGESLIELLVATAILGTTLLTIIGGFLGMSKISGVQRDQAQAWSTLVSASEYAKTRPCAVNPPPNLPSNCPAETNPPGVPTPSGTSVSIAAPITDSTTGLTAFKVTVTTGGASYTNMVEKR